MKHRNNIILEFTEFNIMRFNSDNAGTGSPIVDNPKLSLDAFDKHQDAIRQSMARINDILFKLKGTAAYSDLRSKIAMEDQDIKGIKIQRILKSDHINYDVYITTKIGEEDYWGKISNIIGSDPKFTSEIFKDVSLLQPKEWVIKIKGLVIKTIKSWLNPEPGKYVLINNEIICNSIETGKQMKMQKGIEVELIRSYDDKILIKHENIYYNLVNDNFIYFNWWFEKV